MTRTALCLGAVIGAALTGPALAQQPPQGWQLGAMGVISSSPYVGQDTDARALPLISYRGEGFSAGSNGLSYDLWSGGAIGVAAVLSPRFSALDDPDAPELAGIDREFTVDAGLRLSYDLAPQTRLSLTVLQELTGEHDGQEADLRLSRSLRAGPVPVTVTAGATWRSADLSGYLYGVRATEARIGRPAYDPGTTLTPFLGLSAVLPVTDSVALIGGVRAEFLGDAITDSPIVEDSGVISARFGVSFSF